MDLTMTKNLNLKDAVPYQDGEIVREVLMSNPSTTAVVMSFDKNIAIRNVKHTGEGLFVMLEGEVDLQINGESHVLKAMEYMVVPAGAEHTVHALKRSKFMVTLSK